jgi:hypothetical protein
MATTPRRFAVEQGHTMMKWFAIVLCAVFLAETVAAKDKTYKSCWVVEKNNAIDNFSNIDTNGCEDSWDLNDAGQTGRFCGDACCELVFSNGDGASSNEKPTALKIYNSETVRDA